jgi:hypothetical protein
MPYLVKICSVIIVIFSSAFVQAQDSLKQVAINNFTVFFAKIKDAFKEDSTTYQLSNFSDLEKKYAYPIDLIELSQLENYETLNEYYDAYFIRKLDSVAQIDFSSIHPKIEKTYEKLTHLIEQGKINQLHNSKKELHLIGLLKKQIKKYPAPFSGYYQKAIISIKTSNSEKSSVFLIEYSTHVDVINFGTPSSN